MKDVHIKFWFLVFILALALTGGLASFMASKNTLYRGVAEVGKIEAKASVLLIDETAPVLVSPSAPETAPAQNQKVPRPKQSYASSAQPSEAAAQKEPCSAPSAPIVKNGVVMGCTVVTPNIKSLNLLSPSQNF